MNRKFTIMQSILAGLLIQCGLSNELIASLPAKEGISPELSQFEQLPPDVQAKIASNLSDKELIRLAQTSRQELAALKNEIDKRLQIYWRLPLMQTAFGTHKKSVNTIAFSPDGKMLASGSDDHIVKFWDVQKKTSLPQSIMHTDKVTSIAFSPNGKMIASGSGNTITISDSATGARLLEPLTLRSVVTLAFSPDGKMLAAAGDGVKIWNIESGKQIYDSSQIVRKGLITFLTDTSIATLFKDEIEFVKNITNKTPEQSKIYFEYPLGQFITAYSFSPDKKLAASALEHTVYINTIGEVATKKTLFEPNELMISTLAFASNRVLATGFFEHKVDVWDIQTQKIIRSIELDDSTAALAFSPDGKTLAVGGSIGKVVLIQKKTNS